MTIEISPGQEVDECFVVVGGKEQILPGRQNIRVIAGAAEVRAGVEEVVEEGEVVIDHLLGPEGHQVGPDLKRSLLRRHGVHLRGEDRGLRREVRCSVERGDHHLHEVSQALEELEVTPGPVDAEEVTQLVG